ncbi:MAG: hypothetical protein Q4C41_09770 [Eggerthellaceae bacterium]|nr:hypothetical protein [Eggerthellaceae bacterium]
MDKTFTQALDGLRFTDEAKERMSANLAAAAAGQRQAKVTTGRAARRAARNPWRFAAAASLTAALVLGAGGAAYASGTLVSVADALDDLFNGAPANTEVVDKIGRPIGVSSSSGGVTVTADAIIGDRSNYAIVFSVAKDDGTAFDVQPNENGTLPLMFTGSDDVRVDGASGAAGGSYFYDTDPTDNAVQYVQKISVGMDGAGDALIGKTARVDFSELSLMGEGSTEVVAQGDWKMKFTIDYEDTSVDVSAGFAADLDGMKIDVSNVVVSPIAVSVNYLAHGTLETTSASGKMSDEDSARMDAFFGLPVLITLSDGTVIDATDSAAASRENGDGTTSVRKSLVFDRFVSVDDIASITVAGNEVWAR